MKKSTVLILTLILALASALAIVSCANGGEGGETSSEIASEQQSEEESVKKDPKLTLSRTFVSLDLEQAVRLLAETENVVGEVHWSSSDEKVATVTENGTVRSVGEGSAIITASADGVNASCTVSVSAGGNVPVLKLNDGDETVAKVFLGDAFTVRPVLTYNGERVEEGVKFDFTPDEKSDVTENGVVTGKVVGTTEILVEANWKQFTVYQIIRIEFVKSTYMVAENDVVTVYTSDKFGDNVTAPIGITIVENGFTVENPNFAYDYDEEALKIENGVVSALKAVNAEYTVRISYVGEEDMNYSLTVRTVCPVKDMTSVYSDYYFEAMETYTKEAFNCFTDGSTLSALYDNEDLTENLYSDGVIDLNDKYYGERSWTVYSSAGYGYVVSGNVVTKVITTAEQFRNIFMTKNWFVGSGWTTNANETYYDGYFELGNDIEFETPTYNDCKYKAYDVSGNDGLPDGAGFNGVFDGKGHTVSNIWIYTTVENGNHSNGIFGTIGEKGVVKNVSFINGGGCNWVHGYLANSIAGSVENVFVQADLASYSTFFSSQFGTLAYRVLSSARITDTVTVLSGKPFSTAASYAAGANSFAKRVDGGATLSNNYTYSSLEDYLSVYSKFSASEIKSYKANDAVQVTEGGFNKNYWDLTSGVLPVMKSSLGISQPRITVDTDYALSGGRVEITFNSFVQGYVRLSATKGTLSSSELGEQQKNQKRTIDFTGVSNTESSLTLSMFGRTVQTVVVTVGGDGSESVVDLEKDEMYFVNVWNDGTKKYEANGDFTADIPAALVGKTVSVAYVTDKAGTAYGISVGFNSGKMTVSADALKAMQGEYTLNFIAQGNRYTMALSVVTAEIGTEEQFVYLFLTETRGGSWSADAALVGEMTYDGYYVLKNDIVFSDKYYYSKYRAWGINTGEAVPDGVGFNGTLDGRGYAIDNLGVTDFGSYQSVRGIFGTVGTEGVIKDVAFTNGRMEGTSLYNVASYLANGIAGSLDNVFVHINFDKSTIDDKGYINPLAYGLGTTTVMKDCVTYVTATGSGKKATDAEYGGGVKEENIVNCHVVADDTVTFLKKYYVAYHKTSEVTGGSDVIATAAFGENWTVKNNIPVMKSAIKYIFAD